MRRKKIWAGILSLALLCCSGCSAQKISGEDRKNIDYQVVKVTDMPEQVLEAVQNHRKFPFFLTYESEGSLYIMQGFGKQKTGGYRIQVQEVSASEEAVFVKTELIGPATRQEQKGKGSCPYMVLKTKDCGLPVVFECE